MRSASVGVAFLIVSIAVLVPLIANPAQAAVADWTFLIYLDADNNLESVGILDFLEMASVGSSAQVNIIVQFDRAVGFDTLFEDWTTVKRFRVTQGMAPTLANALVDLGELDMADPATLADFVSWGVATYPARHYFLDLWDHGFGWPGVLQDGTGYMTTAELGTALAQVRSTLGRNLDVVGNDACRMTLEIMYELQPFVDYFVGSQKDEPADGWPYDAFLGAVVASPSMTPIDVGTTLVAAYVASYEGASPYSVTLSLVSSAALPGLVRRLAEFTAELNASVPLLRSQVLAAQAATERYEGDEEYDLYQFAENVLASVEQTRLGRLALNLRDAIASAVIANEVWDNPNPENGIRAQHAHGLSIWFPPTLSDAAYASLTLSSESGWDGFLASYRSGTATPRPTNPSAVSIDTSNPADGLVDTIEVAATPPENGTLAFDLYLGATYIESREIRAAASETVRISFMPLRPGRYSVTVLYYLGGELADVARVAELPIQGRYQFRGMISDLQDRPVVGALVTLANPRAGMLVNTTATATGYAIDVILPDFAMEGDDLVLSAMHEGRRVSVTFVASLAGASHIASLVLDASPASADATIWIALAATLAIVVALLAAIALWQRRTIGDLRRRPGGP